MNSTNKTILIIVIVLIILCCLCSAVTTGGAAIFFALHKDATSSINTISPSPEIEVSPVPADEMTATPAEQPTEVPALAPEATHVPEGITPAGLNVSRADMIQFLNSGDAFNFKDPITTAGFEAVMGYHKTLCLKGDCAAVTLLGPADNLVAVSAAVPTDPNNQAQTLTSVSLLMTLASHFTNGDVNYPTQMFQDIMDAQTNQKALNKKATVNGYKFSESYDPKTHIAAVGISK